MPYADRDNAGKAQLSMVLEARTALNGAAAVMMYGAQKYARRNWQKGMPVTAVADSLLRHLAAYLAGEDTDAESGSAHVDHITVNALFLAEFARRAECDDRASRTTGA